MHACMKRIYWLARSSKQTNKQTGVGTNPACRGPWLTTNNLANSLSRRTKASIILSWKEVRGFWKLTDVTLASDDKKLNLFNKVILITHFTMVYVCKYHKIGYCKYADQCEKYHVQGKCKDGNICPKVESCNLRHPKMCKRMFIEQCWRIQVKPSPSSETLTCCRN